MNALTIGVWAFAFAAASCALAVLWFHRQNRRMLRAVEVRLDGRGETHRASSELMSMASKGSKPA
jgi:hypothetical protein